MGEVHERRERKKKRTEEEDRMMSDSLTKRRQEKEETSVVGDACKMKENVDCAAEDHKDSKNRSCMPLSYQFQ